MSKILIWSLGTGFTKDDKISPNYQPANYKDLTTGKIIENTPYVASAFMQLYNYDKHIIVGTCGSSWYNYYKYITEKDISDEDYKEQLLDEQLKTNHFDDNPDEFIVKLGKLKQADKKCAGIILLKYGVTPEEMQYNFKQLTKIENFVKNGDVLSFDITHSFRSLAFYELLAVTYNMLKKDITLEKINYGMLEIAKYQDNITPMVNLKPINTLIDYIKAAEEYNRYGTTRLLADLIEKDSLNMPNEQKKALKRLGDMSIISSANRKNFKGLVRYCNNYCEQTKKDRTKINLELEYIFKDISKRFGTAVNDDIKLSAELAKWHFEYKRYMESAGCIAEGMLDYFSEISELDKRGNSSPLRKKIWELEKTKEEQNRYPTSNLQVGQLLEMYNTVREVRNDIMHGEEITPERLSILEKITNEFSDFYTKHFEENEENVNDLKNVFH
jgi:CRISPR-associated Csx2 family protein